MQFTEQDMQRPPDPNAFDDEQASEEQARQAEEALVGALQTTVMRRRNEAVQSRSTSGIEQVWRDAEDQYSGFDELNRPGTMVAVTAAAGGAKPAGNGRSRVFINITQPKTDAAESRVCEMLLPTDDRPWDLEPTPVPELAQAIESGGSEQVTLADGTQASAADAAKAVSEKAAKACDSHKKWTEDHFVQGKVYAELRKVIKSAARIGTGIIKGPFPVARRERRWAVRDGVAQLFIQDKIVPTSRAVDPWNFYPDPAAGDDIHAGSFCLERDHLTGRQLRELARDPSYRGEAVREVLKEGPRRVARADRRADRDFPGETQARDTDTFEVWYYYGDVDIDELRALKLDALTEDLAALDPEETHVAAIVTMVNDTAIKAVLNPLGTGAFPYDVFPWEPMPDQPWGRGVPHKMATAQRMLNAAARAMLDNAGLSAGPQIIIRKGMVEPADKKYEITGRKLWFFTGDDTVKDVREVMQVLNVESAQQELSNIIEFAQAMADETASVPQLLQGEQNPGQPETLGGLTMRNNNASSMLRRVAKQFDDSIVVPHMTRWYDFGMEHGPEDIKGDLQVRAKGSSTLVQRDQASQFLMQSAAMLQNPEFRIDPAKWFAEVCRSNHFDPRTIQFTEDEWKTKQEEAGQQPPPQDPRVQAAEIRREATQAQIEANRERDQQRLAFEAQDAAAEREHQRFVKEIEREIQVMEFAGRREISLEQIKAMLASKAADLRQKGSLFQQERALKLATGSGI